MKYIIIHHSANNNGFNVDNEYHRKKWNFRSKLGYYIGYHWYWDKKKGWIQGRAEDETAAHTIGYNDNIGICLQGNYNRDPMTSVSKLALEKKIADIRSRWGNLPLKTHRELSSTECPGDNLQSYVNTLRTIDMIRAIPAIPESVKNLIISFLR